MTPRLARFMLAAVVAVSGVAIVVARNVDGDAVAVAVNEEPEEHEGNDPAATEPPVGQEQSAADGDTPAAENTDSVDLPVLAESAPEVQASGWLNTEPLTQGDVSGRVVLYEFWTFGCVNCRNVLPHLKAWHDRYAKDGLLVLSVHTPEFDYEKDADAVADFVAEESIRYPVALDPDKRTWRAFDNHYWPAFYLHDADGRRRLVHYGEGDYDDTEDAIRSLLGVADDAPRAEVSP